MKTDAEKLLSLAKKFEACAINAQCFSIEAVEKMPLALARSQTEAITYYDCAVAVYKEIMGVADEG